MRSTFALFSTNRNRIFSKIMKETSSFSERMYLKLYILIHLTNIVGWVPMVIQEFARLLEDGQWHTFTEIRDSLSLSEAELRNITEFLKKFEFICVDEKEEKVKVDASLLELPT